MRRLSGIESIINYKMKPWNLRFIKWELMLQVYVKMTYIWRVHIRQPKARTQAYVKQTKATHYGWFFVIPYRSYTPSNNSTNSTKYATSKFQPRNAPERTTWRGCTYNRRASLILILFFSKPTVFFNFVIFDIVFYNIYCIKELYYILYIIYYII